ncbi:hypothetical protein FPV67DRAFT_1690750 [Lyophyllum atratum]|nr:hypothetical protein FPV67DRAFT_1690750 [Lyophyllum atratum]
MEARAHRVVVSTAGFLFASVGFSLSVLAILFALLTPILFAESTKPSPSVVATLEKRRARQVPVSVKPSSEISSTPSLAPSTPGQREAIPDVAITTHNDVRSPPSPSGRVTLPPSLKRKPTTITFVQDLHMTSLPASSSKAANPICSERVLIPSELEEIRSGSGFKLSNLKPSWAEKRPKLYRAVSSPHLTSSPPLPLPARDEPRKPSPLGKKRSKPLRKDIMDDTTARSASCPVVTIAEKKPVEKKKSQTLRTQPYEAPYFFPPPVPSIPASEALRRRKPTRSRTQPPRGRSASPSPTPRFQMPGKSKVVDGSLAPPTDHHVAPVR